MENEPPPPSQTQNQSNRPPFTPPPFNNRFSPSPHPQMVPPSSGKKWKIGCFFGCGCLIFLILITGFLLLMAFAAVSCGSFEDSSTGITTKTVSGFDRDSYAYIAVIPVHGVIMPNGGKGGVITPEQFSAMMEKAEKDKNVKAVIISIDSPGGEVNAADEIYRRILAFRKNTRRPVIALMKSIAASGGYYIAAGCDKIVAADMTLTGSIGVIISSYNVTGLLDKIGVKGEVYKSGEMKDMLSPTKTRTPEEQKIVQELVQECYIKFATIVSKSRNIPLEKITKGPVGDGRVYHGKKALSYGLVDQIGHLKDAVDLCEQMTFSGKNTLTVKAYKKELSFMDMLMESTSSAGKGVNVNLSLPGNTRSVELEPGRIYFLPEGL